MFKQKYSKDVKMRKITFFVLSAVIVSGCLTENQKESTLPSPNQFRKVGNQMIQRMVTDRNFLDRSYPKAKRRAKERGDDLPTITVDLSKPSAVTGITDYVLGPMRDEFKVMLRKTDKFYVKDVQWSDFADYGLSAILRMSEDQRHYYLVLSLLDYAKKDDNKEIWNEFEEVGNE